MQVLFQAKEVCIHYYLAIACSRVAIQKVTFPSLSNPVWVGICSSACLHLVTLLPEGFTDPRDKGISGSYSVARLYLFFFFRCLRKYFPAVAEVFFALDFLEEFLYCQKAILLQAVEAVFLKLFTVLYRSWRSPETGL